MSYAIGAMNGLLDGKHKRRIGGAIWYFLVLVDWQTDVDGRVLGGRLLTLAEVAARFDESEATAQRALAKLEAANYIARERGQCGFSITICAPKKPMRNGEFRANRKPLLDGEKEANKTLQDREVRVSEVANSEFATSRGQTSQPREVSLLTNDSKRLNQKDEDTHAREATKVESEKPSIGDLMEDLEKAWPGDVTDRTDRHVLKFLQRPEIDPDQHEENLTILRRMIADVPTWAEHYRATGKPAPNLRWWIVDYRPDAKFAKDPTIAYLEECERRDRERAEAKREARRPAPQPDPIPLPVDREREPDGGLVSMAELAKGVSFE